MLKQAEHHSRWRPAVSLRALMILVVTVGGGLGWLAHRARVQREAILAIKWVGGSITYDWEVAGGKYIPNAQPRQPRWLRRYVWPEFFQEVVWVSLAGSQVTDEVMAQVGELGSLERLTLSNVSVTDAGMAHLRGLTGLQVLSLGLDERNRCISLTPLARLIRLRGLELFNTIDDAALAHLSGMRDLEELAVHAPCPDVTDAGLAHLARLTKLRTLTLRDSRVTEVGLAHLRGMTHLQTLMLPRAQVRSLAPLRHLNGIQALDLSRAPIDDAGLAPIASLTALTRLRLDQTQITDESLALLASLPRLRFLSIRGTPVTDAGIAALRKARLGMSILPPLH
jgi:internalin A